MIFGFLLGDRARRSPRKLPTAMKEERKKWAMPKFLPHKYDVKLINEDKVCFCFFFTSSLKKWCVECVLFLEYKRLYLRFIYL